MIVALGHELPIPRGTHGVSTALLLYLGMVPLFLKHRAFDLERWWFEAWIWFLGGALVVGVDLLLIYALSLHASTALAISLVVVGWIYFPMRQWLLASLRRHTTLVTCHPSAGLPDAQGRHPIAPADFARHVAAYAAGGLAGVVGGCCGTTPEHVAALARAVRQ